MHNPGLETDKTRSLEPQKRLSNGYLPGFNEVQLPALDNNQTQKIFQEFVQNAEPDAFKHKKNVVLVDENGLPVRVNKSETLPLLFSLSIIQRWNHLIHHHTSSDHFLDQLHRAIVSSSLFSLMDKLSQSIHHHFRPL